MTNRKKRTDWETSASWYTSIVDEKGHFYHREVVIPNTLDLLQLKKGDAVVDLACGQGVLARALPKHVKYLGVDGSKSLIAAAKKQSKHTFKVHDLCTPFSSNETFSHAVICLALQNIGEPDITLQSAYKLLKKDGKLLLIMNHPCFRIPRQTHWGVDEGKKLQYRRIDAYMTPLSIPIQTAPSRGKKSETTTSFHYPLSELFHMLKNAGFMVADMHEWVSPKKSSGGKARMENKARKEFPLFLAIEAVKV